MSNHPSTKINILPDSDPCSARYQCADHTASVETKKAKFGLFRSFKKFLGIGSQRPISFVMMNESVKQAKRRSIMTSTSTEKSSSRTSIPTPNRPVATATTRHERRSYRVHSYNGTGSLPTRAPNSVRFSHPAVSQEILPTTSSSPALLAVPEHDDSEDVASKRASAATDFSDTSSDRDSGRLGVSPKEIFRYSSQSVTLDGHRETYSEFKDRLDGHKPRADRLSTQRPPSLSFIPRTGTIKLDEYDSPQFRSSFKQAEDAEKHRSDALSKLEGRIPQKTQDRYVLAIMPREHLPTTAIQVSSDAHPSNLIPGGSSSQARPNLQRPHTFAGPAPRGQVFQPYSPESFAMYQSAKKDKKPAGVADGLLNVPTFDTKSDAESRARHSQHYKRVESGEFDVGVTPAASSGPVFPPRKSSKLPPQPDTSSSFLLSPSPPPPPSLSGFVPYHTLRKAELRKSVVCKPVLVDIPASKSASNSSLVPPIPMNANGYPTLSPHPSKRFSSSGSASQYQKRTVDSVEAKYMKENPKKVKNSKSEKHASKSKALTNEKLTERTEKPKFLDSLVWNMCCR